MKKNNLFVFGIIAMMASCSNGEMGDQKGQDSSIIDIPFDGRIALSASPEISVTETRAAVTGWTDTPIRVWGLNNTGTGWDTDDSCLFPGPNHYANGVVDSNGNVVFDGSEVYFYPLNSDVDFSFYSCSPQPQSTITQNAVLATYDITGAQDIRWGEAIAADAEAEKGEVIVDGIKYNGYNARYFRKGGKTPVLKFKHLLTQLQFKGIKGDEGGYTTGDGVVWPVSIRNIEVISAPKASLVVAGANKGTLTAAAADDDIPVYFEGDIPYSNSTATDVSPVENTGANAGTTMVLPSTTGTYKVKVTLVANVNGKDKTQENIITITYKKDGAVAPFEAGKIYTVNLTIYGLRLVDLDASLEPWTSEGAIDQEVN